MFKQKCVCVCIQLVMVTMQNWHKNRHIDQWNRQESPDMNIHLHGQLIYDKGGQMYNGENTASSVNCVGKTGQIHKNKKSVLFYHTNGKVNSKWTKDL